MADRVVGVLVGEPDEAELLVRLLGVAGIEAGIIEAPAELEAVLDQGVLAGLVVAATVGQASGVRLLQSVRSRDDRAMAGAPLVLVTDRSLSEQDWRAVDELGHVTVLEKPFHVDELVAAFGDR